MERKRILKHFQTAWIAGAVILAVFGIDQQEVKAVGINVGENVTDDVTEGSEPGANTNAGDTTAERKISPLSDSTGSFNIGQGNIILSKNGKYTQTDEDGSVLSTDTFDSTYKISQSSDKYNITVEEGASPVIDVSGLSISKPTENEKSGSGMYIKSGAVVTLVLGPGAKASFTGSDNYPGITLEEGATLKIEGNGSLNVISGSGACGISAIGNNKGGKLCVGENTILKAYSSQKEGAICADVMASSHKILQGTLLNAATPPAKTSSVLIKVENRDHPTQEAYSLDLPGGYCSFAVSTTTEGGFYVSYYPGDDGKISKNTLLADTQHIYTYDLTGQTNVFASLGNLAEEAIKYEIKLNANGGTFNDPNDARKTQTVGYGDSIALPEKSDLQRKGDNYEFIGWYRMPDSMQADDKWKDTDRVVENMLELYAGWEGRPLKVYLHVKYEPGNKDYPWESADITYPDSIRYGDYLDKTILETLDETAARPGYTLNGWYTDENYTKESKWNFATKKAEPDDEALHLYAYWSCDEYTADVSTSEKDVTEKRTEQNNILTGDKAPLTDLIMKLFVSMTVIIGILRKKYMR